MKFSVERDVLAEAVTWTARSLSPRPPVPVLSGLLIRAQDGALSIASFDYEISARLSISADVQEEGTTLVSNLDGYRQLDTLGATPLEGELVIHTLASVIASAPPKRVQTLKLRVQVTVQAAH